MNTDALDFLRDEYGHWLLNGQMLTDNVMPMTGTCGDLAYLLETAYQAGIRDEGTRRLIEITDAISDHTKAL